MRIRAEPRPSGTGRWRWIAFLAMGLVSASVAAWWVRAPGYMDADYYYATALEIVAGRGLSEPFLWNYLDDPSGIPHPSHLYWMPLVSFVSSASMALLGPTFRAAQLPFVLMAGILPILAASIAARLGVRGQGVWEAAALAAFPGFYLSFLVTTDGFALYAIVGALALLAMSSASQRPRPQSWLIAGILIGLAHLTRADGLLLLVPGVVAVAWSRQRPWRSIFILGVGYLLLMIPWWARNIAVAGSPFPAGLSRSLWLADYDDLFAYPASQLTPERLWSFGVGSILLSRLAATWTNLKSLVAANGLVFLGPFVLLGAKRAWDRPIVRLSALYLVLLFIVMSLVFPFAGERGGFFHSSAALMPLFWALAPIGLEVAVIWASAKRRWNPNQAVSVLGWAAVAMAGLLSMGLLWSRTLGPIASRPRWGASARTYDRVAEELLELDETPGVVAVNNPPGFYLASGTPCVAIPNGALDSLQQVAERYGVRWVVLDANRPKGLAELYRSPEMVSWLELAESMEDMEGGRILLLRVDLPEIRP